MPKGGRASGEERLLVARIDTWHATDPGASDDPRVWDGELSDKQSPEKLRLVQL